MTPTPITVTWSLAYPPVAVRQWHTWNAAPTAPTGPELAGERRLEAQLAWPPGTIAALHAAFEIPLSRSVGWDVPGTANAADQAAFREAARWFRRGVGVKSAAPGASLDAVATGSYAVRFAAGDNEQDAAKAPGEQSRWFVIDGNVATFWSSVAKTIQAKHVLTLNENEKTLGAVANVLDAWRSGGKPKQWTIVAGGLLADVAAFAAALVGASFRFVPTTLLAMADACVGGKTGVNFPPFGKNQVGAFAFPDDVLIWPGWLRTLPQRERHAGGAECVKHALLANDIGWAKRLAEALASSDLDQLGAELPRVVAVKAEIVERDPGEAGERAILNLGHTLGHALEGLSQRTSKGATTLLHGEAVAYGMMFAILLSQRVSRLPAAEAKTRIEIVRRACKVEGALGLERRLGGVKLGDAKTWAALVPFLQQDKKSEAGAAHWILLGKDGAPARTPDGAWTRAVPPEAVEATWQEFVAAL